MSLLLEVLVAKGRRVQHPREQREVAFGLADLSTNPHLCIRIAAKGGIPTLVRLLSVSKDAETQRLSALALSNLASLVQKPCSISRVLDCRDELVNDVPITNSFWEADLDSVRIITKFLKDDGVDTVARRYGALILGNLAADANLHSCFEGCNGISTLVSMLNFALAHQDLELGRCVALAIANLSIGSVFTSIFINHGVLEKLVSLIQFFVDDWTVQTQALIAIRGLMFSDTTLRTEALQRGILDSLVLMANSTDESLKIEVARSFYCLSCVEENKENIAQVAFATILSFSLSEVVILGQYACSTLANLVERLEIHPIVVEQKGILSILSILASHDSICVYEGCRAMANLSANMDIHHLLLNQGCLEKIMDILSKSSERNCQKYLVLSLANFSVNPEVHVTVDHLGGFSLLMIFIQQKDALLEIRLYALLAFANLTASAVNIATFVQIGGLKELLTMEGDTSDSLLQFYAARILRNISSNCIYHSLIVQEDGVRSLVRFSLSDDPDICLEGVATLRSLSSGDDVKLEIIQKGGLRMIHTVLKTGDVELLLEVTAYLCNLSFSHLTRTEVSTSSIIALVFAHVLSEHDGVARQCCVFLANVAERQECYDDLSTDDHIDILMTAMRSGDDIIRREAGRVLANVLAHSSTKTICTVIEHGAHLIFISCLYSRDASCRRVGALGISNLCMGTEQMIVLASTNVLEPLRALAGDNTDIECQRLALLSIAKLSTYAESHAGIIHEGLLNLLISLNQSSDFEVRHYSALTVCSLVTNPLVRECVIFEGGLEAIFFLARSTALEIKRETLPAITSLTFVTGYEKDICSNGGLGPITDVLGCLGSDLRDVQLSCCAIANMTEMDEVIPLLVRAGVLPLMARALARSNVFLENEIFRSICNITVHYDYCSIIFKYSVFASCLFRRLASSGCEGLLFPLSVLINLIQLHEADSDVISYVSVTSLIIRILEELNCHNPCDIISLRLLLLALLNTCAHFPITSCELSISSVHTTLIQLTLHVSIEIRRLAVMVLGNWCTHICAHDTLVTCALPTLISSSFPTSLDSDRLSHFQAIAGLRALASNSLCRARIIDNGGFEPLFLSLSEKFNQTNLGTMREATFCLFNLTFSSLTTYDMLKTALIEILLLILSSGDNLCQAYALASLGNVAENGVDVQNSIIEHGCLSIVMKFFYSKPPHGIYEAARFLALFSTNSDTYSYFMKSYALWQEALDVNESQGSRFIWCCGIFIMGNLALEPETHMMLIENYIFDKIQSVSGGENDVYKRYITYSLKHFAANPVNHQLYNDDGILQGLVQLLNSSFKETQLEACNTLRAILSTDVCRTRFLAGQGLTHFYNVLFSNTDLEVRGEILASLQNLSISFGGKEEIFMSNCWSLLLEICRSDDDLAHIACATVANVSEASEIQEQMILTGLVHSLTFTMRSQSDQIILESVRTIANLSSNAQCVLPLVRLGTISSLMKPLSSSDSMCNRYAAMALSNLTVIEEGQMRLLDERGIHLLFKLLRQENGSVFTQHWAIITLSNLSSCFKSHDELLHNGITDVIKTRINDNASSITLKDSAYRCLSNLSSNKIIHEELNIGHCLNMVMAASSPGKLYEQPLILSIVRGLSQSDVFRETIVSGGILQSLIPLCKTKHAVVHHELFSTLCNLSATQTIAGEVYNEMGLNGLTLLLNNDDRASKLFAVNLLGNLVGLKDIAHSTIFSLISPIIPISNELDEEISRCVGLTICNILENEALHADVIREGGIAHIMSLLLGKDAYTALQALRYLSSFPARREGMVRCNVIQSLIAFIRMNSNIKYIEAVTAIFYYLSLDDFCKEFLIKSEFHCVSSLISARWPMETVTAMVIRIASNCCELPSCHNFLINYVSSLLLSLCDVNDIRMLREIARLINNISLSSSFYLTPIDRELITHHLISLCQSNDDIISDYGHLIILNTQITSRNYWPDEQRRSLCGRYMKMIGSAAFDLPRQGPFKRSITYLSLHIMMMDTFQDMTELIVNDLSSDDLELGYSASYALNKSGLTHTSSQLFQDTSFLSYLLNFISKAGLKASSHAVAVLRKLSHDRRIADLLHKHLIESLLPILVVMLQTSSKLMVREWVGCVYNMTTHYGYCHALFAEVIHKYIIPLCASSDDECCRWALGLVANFSEDQSQQESLGVSDITKIISRQLLNGSTAVKREACRLSCNLLSNCNVHVCFLAEGIVTTYLSSTVLEADNLCQSYVALALNKLASVYSNHEILLCDDFFGYLSSITNSGLSSVVIPACRVLKLLSVNDQFKAMFVKWGSLQWTLNLLHSLSEEVRGVIAETLFNLSSKSLLQRWLYEEGIVSHIVKSCSENQKDLSFVITCIRVIANIAYDGHNRRLLLDNHDLMTLLLNLFTSDERKLQESTSKLFSILTSQRYRLRQVHENVLLSSLIHNIIDPTAVTTIYAVITIGNLVCHCETDLIKSDVVQGLAKLLNKNQCSTYACKALSLILCRVIDSSEYCFESDGMIFHLIRLCSSVDLQIKTQALIAICNLCSHKRSHSKVINMGVMSLLVENLRSSSSSLCRETAWKILQNLSRNVTLIAPILKQRMDDILIDISASSFPVENAIWSLSNICLRADGTRIIESKVISSLLHDLCADKLPLFYASACFIYNISMLDISCASKMQVIQLCERLRLKRDRFLNHLAVMVILNLSIDRHAEVRDTNTHGKRLQWIYRELRNDSLTMNVFASLCLCNMISREESRVTIAALEPIHVLLVHIFQDQSTTLLIAASLCVVNICSNHSISALLSREGVMRRLCFTARHEHKSYPIICFIIANMSPDLSLFLSKIDDTMLLSLVDVLDGISNSLNLHIASIATACMTYLTMCLGRSSTHLVKNIPRIIFGIPALSSIDIEREIVSFISFLSRFDELYQYQGISLLAIYRLFSILKSSDKVAVKNASMVLGNITERVIAHQTLLGCQVVNQIKCLICDDIILIKIEALRALCNILETVNMYTSPLVQILNAIASTRHVYDDLCGYFVSLVFRKISFYESYHQWLVSDGLPTLHCLLRSQHQRTIRHGAKALQNLCSNKRNVANLNLTDGVDEILGSLLSHEIKDIKCIGLSVLTTLAYDLNAASRVSDYAMSLIPLLKNIDHSNENLNLRITTVLAIISEYRTDQNKSFLVRSLDVLIRLANSENREIRQNTACALFNFSANEKNQLDMYHQGAFISLMNLTEVDDDICQRYSQLAICFLMTNPQIHKKILQEYDIIHGLVLTANKSSTLYQSLAASSISSISIDDDVKTGLIKKDALQSIFRFTQSLDVDTCCDGLFTVANFAASPKFHHAIIGAGAIQVMNHIGRKDDFRISRNIARFYALLSITKEARIMMMDEDVVANLVHLSLSEDLYTQKYSLISLTNLCVDTEQIGSVLVPVLLKAISYMIVSPSIPFNRCAALSITGISLLNETTNVPAKITTGNIRALQDILRFADDETSVFACTALALISINYGENAYEESAGNDDIICRLFSLLEINDEDAVLSVLLALGSFHENASLRINQERCIHSAVTAVSRFKTKLPILRAAGYLMCIFSESIDSHSIANKTEVIDSLIHIVSQSDEECQDYGTFILACLSQTWNLQVPITKHGAIRPLVKILASDDGVECRHYAAIALLRLADNIENHLIIAQQGGIQALLHLGDSKKRAWSFHDGIQTKASISLGNVAATLASDVQNHRRHR